MFYKILKVFLPLLVVFNLLIYAYIFYTNSAELETYKQSGLTTRAQYDALQEQFTKYKNQTKQLTIVANSSDSKNIKVGDIINTYAQKVNGDVSIYYRNLTTDESAIINGDEEYYMASLYKVILTLYILDRVSKGEINLNDTTPGSSVTVEQALDKIITVSNNEYAVALAQEYGWDNIEAYMKPYLGLDFHFDKDLNTNVKDMGALFYKISLSLDIPRSETSYLLNLLKDQQRTSKLPKYLPEGTYSHNKTGELDDFSHDAGIFYTPKANYILIFMSKTPSPGDTNELMAKMSKDIYDVLNDVK